MAASLAAKAEDRGTSQTIRAQLALRELLMAGDIRPGERLSELAIVEKIGVSRTPVRAALMTLAEEGLLDAIPSGGYAARGFTEREVLDAIEVRGTLEGLAARLAAERGAGTIALQSMRESLKRLDDAVAAIAEGQDAFEAYIEHNAAFHRAIARMADNAALDRQMERAVALPFASPNAFVKTQGETPETRRVLLVAQEQHRSVFEAIERREGSRAEALMREHSRVAARNFAQTVRSRAALDRVPGGALIRLASE
ncbi:MAG: GntR family transcriptional regulator [Alphaproteobacteria bacterium]|nr:GntR family transcriptional regulator [Alphaproteobacteria bacterium]MCA0450588.1 GntR family transcriptional regulator [Pseudomonadota bacterium]